MQPNKPVSPQALAQTSAIGLDSETPLSLADTEEAAQVELYVHKQRRHALMRFGLLGAAACLVVAGVLILLFHKSSSQANLQLGAFPVTHITLPNLNTIPQNTQQSLQVNGQLEANNSLVLTPTTRPAVPVLGQMYFDKSVKQLLVYNGTGFQPLGNTIINTQYSTTQLGNTIINQGDTVVNNITEGVTSPTVLLQGNTPGTPQHGSFNVTGTGQVGSLNVSGNANINTATVQNTLIAGGMTTSDISAPSDSALAISTPAGSAATGSINIHTGDSSTTASGDINIDTGVGVVDGEVIETKTFEDGADNMINWYNTTTTTTTTQAHGGAQSLQVTTGGGNWGIISNENYVTATAIPGHTYYFSMWIRAATTSRTISAIIHWGSTSTALTSKSDTPTGWTQISGISAAPADASSIFYTITSNASSAGEVHYIDDMQITDLSSASAASQISIGTTNAKLVTIGNMNEIGATTINGSSGIALNSGNGSIQENGGVITLNASAASSFTASRGSLTLTGAATSSWGLIQAASGIGGDLTIHAGKGGAETNNNGGNLILQGGGATGTGTAGSVIILPTANTTTTFQIQNAAASTFLDVDTANARVGINRGTAPMYTLDVNGDVNGWYYRIDGDIVLQAPNNTNIFTGENAGTLNASGNYNVAAGYDALSVLTNADGNTAIGAYALQNTTTGGDNTAIGRGALAANADGYGNVAVGAYALQSNTSGWGNIAFGTNALAANTDQGSNVAIGTSTLQHANAYGNTAIGADSLNADTTGGSNTAIGPGTMQYNTDGYGNVAIGPGTLQYNVDGSNNTIIGLSAAQSSAGNSLWGNTIIGYLAGQNLSNGGNNNTLIGTNVGTNLTSGSGNILIGNNVQANSATTSNQLNIGNTIYGDLSTGSVYFKPSSDTASAFEIQTASGTALLTADTTTSTITITNLIVSGTITIGGHIVTTNTSGSTVATAQAGAGSGATVTLTGDDTAGTVTFTTGTGTGAGALALITFAHPYRTNPIVVLTPANAAAATLSYYYNAATDTFSIMSGSAPAASTTYTYSYHVMQ